MSTLEVNVWRGRADGRFQTFSVPRRDAQTVLDVVTHIQRRLDSTLAYRFACRVGICGSCAMTVNGNRGGPAARTSPRSRRTTSWKWRRSRICRSCAISSPTCEAVPVRFQCVRPGEAVLKS
jgi:ferredoxin